MLLSHPLLTFALPTQTSALRPPTQPTTMATGDFRVADISLADFGRREIELAEVEVRFFSAFSRRLISCCRCGDCRLEIAVTDDDLCCVLCCDCVC